jgi:hypothetical protein
MAEMFDWIFFSIVAVPLVLALIDLFIPSLFESIIQTETGKRSVR